MITISLSAFGQSAQQVLDKTAATIGRKGGASASFRLSTNKPKTTTSSSSTTAPPTLSTARKKSSLPTAGSAPSIKNSL